MSMVMRRERWTSLSTGNSPSRSSLESKSKMKTLFAGDQLHFDAPSRRMASIALPCQALSMDLGNSHFRQSGAKYELTAQGVTNQGEGIPFCADPGTRAGLAGPGPMLS